MSTESETVRKTADMRQPADQGRRPIWPRMARCRLCGSSTQWEASSPSRCGSLQYRRCLCGETTKVQPLGWEMLNAWGLPYIELRPPG